MQAEQEHFDRAGAYWNKIIANAPGRAGNYLEAATLHWDYYRYDEALARINEGRRRLNNPRLFAFEAGAIRENQGDLAAAAREYVAGAMEEGDASNSRQRLIKVATRQPWRQPIDAALTSSGNTAKTLALRVALLESQSRKQDLEGLLTQAAANANTDLLIEIRQHAQRSGLANVERRVLDRQYGLADQPANKMATLAERLRFEDAANAQPAAAQAADTLLRENPRSIGAIRTAVNYFWRSGAKARAAEILLASAPNAYPQLQRQFRLEAIRKLSESGDYARAHREAAPLLAANPIDEQVIALKADAFARAKDDTALSAFYKEALANFQKANQPTATLRRAWIPALIRLNDATGAADQYIELLKQFSEDENLQREAARFAASNGQRERITAYFAKAESDSPRDARWPIVRARLENEFGDFNAALAAWGRAVALRPERVDLLTNRAKLEERLSQFDKATISYRKLFDISFKNAAWLEEGARVLARQGKNDEAVKWLREAFIDNRTPSPNNGLSVAARLLDWGLAEQARAELQAALPAATELEQAVTLYARAAAQLRQLDSITTTLNARVARLAPDKQNQLRQRWLIAAAQTAGPLYTPEEKLRFGTWLEAQRTDTQTLATASLQAGLAETAARAYNAALATNAGGENAATAFENLVRLQTQRQQFGELGRQVEAYYRLFPNNDEKIGLLRRARNAYFAAGDDAGELRTLNAILAPGAISDDERDRLFELTTRRAPATVAPRQAQDAAYMDALANYALRTGKAPIATQAIANRRGPLWQNASRAITGLYFGENSPAVRKAFLDSLGPERIGDKLALAGNRDATLAGDVWFYYAGRYGAWLQIAQDNNSPHYLAALVERRANSASAYLNLGEESGGATAEQAYRTALILDTHQPIAYARLAAIAATKQEKAQLYRQAIDELRWWQDNRRVQEWFWSEAARTMREAGAAGLRDDLRDNVDTLIRAYVKRNGAYRVRELLEGALNLSGDPAAGVQWIAQISRSAADPAGFLAQLNNESWLPESGRETLLKLQTDFAVDRLNRATGEERGMAQEAVDSARVRYATYLLKHNRAAQARPVIEALWVNPELRHRYDISELRLLLAAAEKRVDAVLADLPKDAETLRNLGTSLRRLGLNNEARTVLFASYELDLKNGNVDSAIPGLAALHIEAGAPEKALPLLDIYVMQADTPFARHQTAGDLFLRNKRRPEAIRYLEPLVAAEPWNRAARALLAEAREDEAAITAVTADQAATYNDRLRAALWIGANRAKAIQSGSGELDFLARNMITDVASEQPLWAAARRLAATNAKNDATKIRLYRAILAINPNDDDSALKLFRALLASGRPREASSAIEERLHTITEQTDRARLADAYVRTNQLQRALNMFDQIFDIGPAEQTARWQNAYNIVRAQAGRDEQNQSRRPVIGEELEQRNLVKPRLVAAPQGGAR
jgi:tetratricopeptide (TPR) repeat protein